MSVGTWVEHPIVVVGPAAALGVGPMDRQYTCMECTRVSLPLTRGKPAISDSTAYWPTPRPTRAVDGAEATAWSLQSEV